MKKQKISQAFQRWLLMLVMVACLMAAATLHGGQDGKGGVIHGAEA